MIKEDLEKLIAEGKKFPVILADPPWQFATYSSRGKAKAPEKHYHTMSLENIKKLPVAEVAEKDCVLYLWVYNPMIPQGLEVMKAWGFEFVTLGFTWRKVEKSGKDKFGLGYYTRQSTEICLIGKRGKPGRPKSKSVRQIINDVARAHSQKPDCIYDRIEAMYDGPYLELFARNEPRTGWTKLGDEVGKL